MKTASQLHLAKTLRSLRAAVLFCATAVPLSAAHAQADASNKSSRKCHMLLFQQQAPVQLVTSPSLRDNDRSYNPLTGNFEEPAPVGPRSNR